MSFGLEPGHGGVQQAHLAVVTIADDVILDAAALGVLDQKQVQERETAAGLLGGGLGILRLVGRGVRQGQGGAVHGLDRPALQRVRGQSGALGGLGADLQGRLEQGQRQARPGLAVGAGAGVDDALALQGEHGLELAHDLAAGAVGLELLPQEAPAGAAHRVGPFPRAGRRGGQDRQPGQEGPQAGLELVERAALQALEHGGRAVEATAPGGKKRSIQHRAVDIPPC